MDLDERPAYYLKPMNCPFHMLIFRVAPAQSTANCHCASWSSERCIATRSPGVVHGLTRVRGFTQDDAHIFCTREQMAEELTRTLDFVLDLLRDFGLNDFYLELSTKPAG